MKIINNRITNQVCKLIFTSCLSLGLMLTSHCQASTQPLDQITAVVNDDIILQSEVTKRLQMNQAQLKNQNKVQSDKIDFKQQVIEQLIMESLQLQLAQQHGVSITEQRLNQTMLSIADDNQMTLQQLKDALVREGNNYIEFRRVVERNLIIKEIQQLLVQPRVRVSDYEIDQYLDSTAGKQMADTQYRLAHLLISLPPQPVASDVATASQLAQNIYEQLQQGADFYQLTITHSDAHNALSGGDLGWRKGSQLPQLFADQVDNMQVGDFSEPIRNINGFHLIKLKAKRGASVQNVRQVQVTHILISPNELRTLAEAGALAQELYQRLLEDGDLMQELARTFSDDKQSAASGGDLGWLNVDQLPDVISQQVEQLQNGETSPPFTSSAGWHLVQLTDTREKDFGVENLRRQARMVLASRKFSNELESWLQEVRNQAYIEVRSNQ